MKKDNLQRNFEGYLNSSLLWRGAEVYDLQQCFLESSIPQPFTKIMTEQLRLGKLVERFVFHQLVEDRSRKILAQNVQIQAHNRTLGELDALLMTPNGPIHLEIIYKFYLYDPNEGKDELSHWIGPNRKDSLLQKLDKLKNKQLPLLYHPETHFLLNDL
ncbi:MAG: DUF1853 family protein, partial [Gelidibacter sp.]